MNTTNRQTADILLKWLQQKLEGNCQDKVVRLNRAKKLARDYWDEFGPDVIKEALKQYNCVTIRDFERLCLQIRELPKQKPVWSPPN